MLHLEHRGQGAQDLKSILFSRCPGASLCGLGWVPGACSRPLIPRWGGYRAEGLVGLRALSGRIARHLHLRARSARTLVCRQEGVLTYEALAARSHLVIGVHLSSVSPRCSGGLPSVTALFTGSAVGPPAGRCHRAHLALCLPMGNPNMLPGMPAGARPLGALSRRTQLVGGTGGVWVPVCLPSQTVVFPGEAHWETLSG